jgi:hypothetical protein
MAGTAILDPNVLVDDLISTIDELRNDLHTQFGVRAYRVYRVTRTWTGSMVGDGSPVDVEVELAPQPLVHPFASLSNRLEPCGLNEAGYVEVTEVSLSYTFDELGAGEPAMGAQSLIKIVEAHGQLQPARYFTHNQPPYPDRIDDMGWVLNLVKVEG